MLLKRLKKVLLSIIISSVVLSFNIGNKKVYAQESYSDEDIVIALDYGHNLNETYKSDPNGVLEVEYAYKIGKKVKENIEAARQDVKIYETNPDKRNKLRSGRAIQCKNNNADFLISLHMDSMGKQFDNRYRGTHVIVDKDSRENVTQYIAKRFIKDYSEDTGIPIRLNSGFDNTRDNIGILDAAEKLHIPAFLLEVAMYSNPIEYEMLNNEESLNNISNAISDGILNNVVTYLDKTHSNEINEQNQYIKCKIGS